MDQEEQDDQNGFGYEYDSENDYIHDDPIENVEEIGRQNEFLDAEDLKDTDPNEAKNRFFNIILQLEEDRSADADKWKFKCYVKIIEISIKTQDFSELQNDIEKLLQFVNSVSKNESTEALTKIIDTIGILQNYEAMQGAIENILKILEINKLDQLWFNGAMKLCKIYLDKKDWANLSQLIDKGLKKCQNPDGQDDNKKSNILLDFYTLDIQLAYYKKDQERLKYIYQRSQKLNFTIADPKSIATLKELSGKILMMERRFSEAREDFQESFKNYQEVGNPQAKTVLRYLTLAGILAKFEVSPFHQREAQGFSNDTLIYGMLELRTAYEQKNIARFCSVITNRVYQIQTDEFMGNFVEDAIKIVTLDKIIALIIPYKRVNLKYLAIELQTTMTKIEAYLVELIQEQLINGKIDAVDGYYQNYNYFQNQSEKKNIEALKKFVKEIQLL